MNDALDVRLVSRLARDAARGELDPLVQWLLSRYGRRRALEIVARSVVLLERAAALLAVVPVR
jgi:hypothetical protein